MYRAILAVVRSSDVLAAAADKKTVQTKWSRPHSRRQARLCAVKQGSGP